MMKTLSSTTGNGAIALDNADKGIVSIPCHPGTKIPCVRWKEWQNRIPPEGLIRKWFSDARRNIAIITTGMVLFDVDDIAKAELVLRHCGDTPHKVRTPRGGIHLGYRKRKGSTIMNRVRIKGQPIDIRTDGGLEMIPHSVTADGTYTWLGKGLLAIPELPVAKIGWTRERTRTRIASNIDATGDGDFMEYRASRWLQEVDGAVSGHQGHNKTFYVACRLTHLPPSGFGLGFEAAMRRMLVWNGKCEPPWSKAELRHKVLDAIKKRK